MPRIRTLTVAGVLAGATVLGGAGLAGATSDDTDIEPRDQELVEVSDSQEAPDLSTFESDEAPTAPELPDTAADRAVTALEEVPAFAADDADSTEPTDETGEDTTESEIGEDIVEEETDGSEDGTTEDDEVETSKPDNHGQRVSEVARTTEPGPDHGPTVAAEAKKNGQGGDVEDDAGEQD